MTPMLSGLLLWSVILGVLLGAVGLAVVALGGVEAAWDWLRGRRT